MVEAGANRRAKRYALEIRQWLDSLLNDSDLLECIEFESEYTVEGLSRKVKEYKKENDLYKKEIEDLNLKVQEASEFMLNKNRLLSITQEYSDYKSNMTAKLYEESRKYEEQQEKLIGMELHYAKLEGVNNSLSKMNEDLRYNLEKKTKEIHNILQEKINTDNSLKRIESEMKFKIDKLIYEKNELEKQNSEHLNILEINKKEIENIYMQDLKEKDLQIQGLHEECSHNKFRITELERLLKMAENEQLVARNYRSLIEQYKQRLQKLENVEKNYSELQDKCNSLEKVTKQQNERLEEAQTWLERMIELEQINNTISQQLKQWETMALKYTQNLNFKQESSNSNGTNDLALDTLDRCGDTDDNPVKSENSYSTISPTSVLSAIFEFQRRYQDIVVSKAVSDSAKIELEDKLRKLEDELQNSQRDLKQLKDELNIKRREYNKLLENSKKLECELKIAMECLSKEGKFGKPNPNLLNDENNINKLASNTEVDYTGRDISEVKLLEEKMKIITHLENELKLRNDEIKAYWSIRVAYDTLAQERDSLVESYSMLQSQNNDLKQQLLLINDKLKKADKDFNEANVVLSREDLRDVEERYQQELQRNRTLNEYYITEKNNLIDVIANILGWRIEMTCVEGGLTAYKLSNIFSQHSGELVFVIRPAPTVRGSISTHIQSQSLSQSNVTNSALLINETVAAEMEEQLTLDFIGYYAHKFENDPNWALQLTATQSYPAFMSYTCLEEFHHIRLPNSDNPEE
ncbi:uncharacterized protein CMU_041560 [Cryptosporidium muris RN66]|uniref:Uncharacterized protein n=1 Tax=Cryptosporidium muris (strain RN66) TaxID=441375 RepID=B6AA43_CRYMR|nr:uncharacterized protein CMU_041560 [Cryptosporidium muris RN66]EEA05084.1 hypothetical protein, conserved [Cryptosporidium muris RN66]|eukprot:XP_002139433.1 hypothetical protein [Cryptosporidium muris RN66]